MAGLLACQLDGRREWPPRKFTAGYGYESWRGENWIQRPELSPITGYTLFESAATPPSGLANKGLARLRIALRSRASTLSSSCGRVEPCFWHHQQVMLDPCNHEKGDDVLNQHRCRGSRPKRRGIHILPACLAGHIVRYAPASRRAPLSTAGRAGFMSGPVKQARRAMASHGDVRRA